uniref:Uncharacterized protein n=1 Tax=Rhizophora mucronata TaxID=61149 RepID=A0A2P2R0I5_RHIMU
MRSASKFMPPSSSLITSIPAEGQPLSLLDLKISSTRAFALSKSPSLQKALIKVL